MGSILFSFKLLLCLSMWSAGCVWEGWGGAVECVEVRGQLWGYAAPSLHHVSQSLNWSWWAWQQVPSLLRYLTGQRSHTFLKYFTHWFLNLRIREENAVSLMQLLILGFQIRKNSVCHLETVTVSHEWVQWWQGKAVSGALPAGLTVNSGQPFLRAH